MQHLTPPIYSHNEILLTINCGGLLHSKQQQTRLKPQFGSLFLPRQEFFFLYFFFFFSIWGIAPVLLNHIFAFIGAIKTFQNACGSFFSKVIGNSLKLY